MGWPTAFVLTLVIEAAAGWGILRASRVDVPARRFWATLLVANLTHPVFWLALPPGAPAWAVLAAEAVIALVESVVWAISLRRTVPRPVLTGLALGLGVNAASFAAGLIMTVGG